MVFGLFSKERSLKRAMDKASNKLAQSPDRFAAMQKLADAGTDEALVALLKRFSFAYDKTIEDEQEKQWLYETLVAKGPSVLPALSAYMKTASSVAYPLRVLEKVATVPDAIAAIDALLADEEPGYTRDPTRRTQIIDWLADYTEADDDDIVSRVAPYVADHDENVKFSAIEALGLRTTDDAAEPLIERLLDDSEESKRLKLRIAEILADKKLDLSGHHHEIAALCEDMLSGYSVKNEKLVAN